eukprot:scaffold2731_cov128-Isochrysis_galbana.AAC.4
MALAEAWRNAEFAVLAEILRATTCRSNPWPAAPLPLHHAVTTCLLSWRRAIKPVQHDHRGNATRSPSRASP